MPDTANQIKIFSNETIGNTITFANSRLQTLDRRVGKKQLFFPKEQFSASLDSWDSIPLIFTPDGAHPSDFEAIEKDPVAAATAINGRCVGCVHNPRIAVEGHPSLMASLDIDRGETEIINLYKNGKLSLSTAFMARDDGDKIISPPVPNHVLLFEERVDEVTPVDQGAFVHTITEDKKMVEETEDSKFYSKLKKLFSELMASKETNSEAAPTPAPATEPKPAAPAPTPEQAEPAQDTGEDKLSAIEKALADKDAKIAELESKLTAITHSNTEYEMVKSKLAAYEKTDADRKFEQFMHSIVPEGMRATDAQKTELRQKYDADPVSLMLSVTEHIHSVGSGVTHKTGEPYMNSNTIKQMPNSSVGDLSAVGGK